MTTSPPRGTREEQNAVNVALCERIKAGDIAAEEEIVKFNEAYIYDFVKRIVDDPTSEWAKDQRSEARFGLLIAARKFDPSRGYSFICEAKTWMKKYTRRAYANTYFTVRVPEDLFWNKDNRIACESLEINDEIGEQFSSEDPSQIAQNRIDRQAETDQLHAALATLPTVERTILIMRWGLDGKDVRIWREIGEALDMTETAARSRFNAAMTALRTALSRSPHRVAV